MATVFTTVQTRPTQSTWLINICLLKPQASKRLKRPQKHRPPYLITMNTMRTTLSMRMIPGILHNDITQDDHGEDDNAQSDTARNGKAQADKAQIPCDNAQGDDGEKTS